MSIMTGSNFYDYVLRIFKRTDKSTEVYEAITDAIMEIKLTYFFEDFKKQSYSIKIDVLGKYRIAVPTDFGHLIGDLVLQKDGGAQYPLVKRTKPTFDIKYPHPTDANVNTGVPKDYCLFDNMFHIGPVPDKITYRYEMNYSTEEGLQVISTTTEVPFTNRYRWILRLKVLEILYLGLGNDEEGKKWKALADEKVPMIIADQEFNIDAMDVMDYQDV